MRLAGTRMVDINGERQLIEALARDLEVPFHGLWLEAPARTLIDRVAAREGDASDATAEVVRAQLDVDLSDLAWPRIDADRPIPAVLADAHTAVGLD